MSFERSVTYSISNSMSYLFQWFPPVENSQDELRLGIARELVEALLPLT